MALIPIPFSQSFFPSAPDISVYDVAFPVVQLTPSGLVAGHLGTCFPVANGLYVTAAHLFDAFSTINRELRRPHEQLEQMRLTLDELVNTENMKCGILTFDRNARGGVTLVDGLTMCLSHDMALLFAANDLRGRDRPLLPIIGSPSLNGEIVLVGYPGTENDIQTNPEEPSQVVAELKMLEGRGRITAAYPEGRDKSLAPYPCFETSASMANGQSGGPALDWGKVGVIGINSRSFGEGEDYSIVSWLGKALDVPFGFDDVEFRTDAGKVLPVSNTTLRRLAEAGIVKIV